MAYLIIIALACALFTNEARAEIQSQDDSHIQEGGQFYIEYPFFNLESLLETSDELREQFASLSTEDREMLIESFDLFNEDIQKAFHALTDESDL